MLSRENFIKYMTEAKDLLNASDAIHDALRLLGSDNFFLLDKPFNTIINVISDAMEDEYDYIGYFICELEWGEKAEIDSITETNGTPIPMFTLDDLYNQLVRSKEEKIKCLEPLSET